VYAGSRRMFFGALPGAVDVGVGVGVVVDVGVGVGVEEVPGVVKLKGEDLYSMPPTKAPTENVYAVAGWRFLTVSLALVSSSPATATPLM